VLLQELKKIERPEFWGWRWAVYSEIHAVVVDICGLEDAIARTCVGDKKLDTLVPNGMLRLRLASCY
jgi:hypothetical protein